MRPESPEILLSLPPAAAAGFPAIRDAGRLSWFAASDPPGVKLGSGGGAAHLLVQAWRMTERPLPFSEWLQSRTRILIHGGGESRRLPAYASWGKPLIPLPPLPGLRGQRPDQTLADFQLPGYRRLLEAAPTPGSLLVTSGDVILRFGRRLPAIPPADVVIFGMTVTPEVAERFGVVFTHPERRNQLALFLQKPPAAEIRELAARYRYLVDTGAWLLSPRAVEALMRRCGWDSARGELSGGAPAIYELYSGMGPALGAEPRTRDAEVAALSCAVVPLPDPEFYHLGTSRQLIESVTELSGRLSSGASVAGAPNGSSRHFVASRIEADCSVDVVWAESSCIAGGWSLAGGHVLTGVPDNRWKLRLEQGVCLDFVPLRGGGEAVRAYGVDDSFRGSIGQPETIWLGRPVSHWFTLRGIRPTEAGIRPEMDILDAPLFPVADSNALEGAVIEWLTASEPRADPGMAGWWMRARRLSARALLEEADLRRRVEHRLSRVRNWLAESATAADRTVPFRMDLERAAQIGTDAGPLPEIRDHEPAHARIHIRMWRSALLRSGNPEASAEEERAAFSSLREAILSEAVRDKPLPRCALLEDQIVWSRSPVRLDLAGGWTDTPPYCLLHGGRVVNVAVDLNGQPPVQVFVKRCPRREIVLRSIDLGTEQRIRSFVELADYARPRDDFALARAALALAGFLPEFHAAGGAPDLPALLEELGGGLEISLLAAVPQGSGLGTSSILAATLLGALSEACGLGWDPRALIQRTLALEQMLTTGGGWQDQAGGILRGVKLVETAPGPSQQVSARWLPEHLFSPERANRVMLLYYTGLTRMAKSILQEVVRGMFLNSGARLEVLEEIGENAPALAETIQRADWGAFCAGIDRSWRLNQLLDSGTNPPEVQSILHRVGDYLSAAKLLGAGGGGFLLLLAKDEEAGARIRRELQDRPPNQRSRFVQMSVSETGLESTWS